MTFPRTSGDMNLSSLLRGSGVVGFTGASLGRAERAGEGSLVTLFALQGWRSDPSASPRGTWRACLCVKSVKRRAPSNRPTTLPTSLNDEPHPARRPS